MTGVAQDSQSGAGSLWNTKSWHWEEKDYMKWTKSYFRDSLVVHGSAVTISDVTVEGYSTLSIRKAKPMVAFELKIEGAWTHGNEKGSFLIAEFSNTEDTPEIRITPTGLSDSIRSPLTACLQSACSSYVEKLIAHETDSVKLGDDRIKRAECVAQTKSAESELGVEKQRLLEEQKAAERQLMEAKRDMASVELSGQSKWNSNAYHWEEKNFDVVVKTFVTSKLQSGPFDFKNVSVSGEARKCIRKGKHIVTFELSFTADLPSPATKIDCTNLAGDAEDPEDIHVKYESGEPVERSRLDSLRAPLLELVHDIKAYMLSL